MTREDAGRWAEILKAYADGKKMQRNLHVPGALPIWCEFDFSKLEVGEPEMDRRKLDCRSFRAEGEPLSYECLYNSLPGSGVKVKVVLDANGNLLQRDNEAFTHRFEYDDENRLVHSTGQRDLKGLEYEEKISYEGSIKKNHIVFYNKEHRRVKEEWQESECDERGNELRLLKKENTDGLKEVYDIRGNKLFFRAAKGCLEEAWTYMDEPSYLETSYSRSDGHKEIYTHEKTGPHMYKKIVTVTSLGTKDMNKTFRTYDEAEEYARSFVNSEGIVSFRDGTKFDSPTEYYEDGKFIGNDTNSIGPYGTSDFWETDEDGNPYPTTPEENMSIYLVERPNKGFCVELHGCREFPVVHEKENIADKISKELERIENKNSTPKPRKREAAVEMQ